MIIPAKKLFPYLNGINFPIEILDETGSRVVSHEDRRGLIGLIQIEAVVGIGSWKSIRKILLNSVEQAPESGKARTLTLSAYSGQRYIDRERLSTGNKVWRLRHICPDAERAIGATVASCISSPGEVRS